MMTMPNLDMPMPKEAIPSVSVLADVMEELDRLTQVPSLSSILEPLSLAIHADGYGAAQWEGARPGRGSGHDGGAEFIDAALRAGDEILVQADKTACGKELFDRLEQELSKLSTKMTYLQIDTSQILAGVMKIGHALSSMKERVDGLEMGQLFLSRLIASSPDMLKV
jgi:hypothetical protein